MVRYQRSDLGLVSECIMQISKGLNPERKELDFFKSTSTKYRTGTHVSARVIPASASYKPSQASPGCSRVLSENALQPARWLLPPAKHNRSSLTQNMPRICLSLPCLPTLSWPIVASYHPKEYVFVWLLNKSHHSSRRFTCTEPIGKSHSFAYLVSKIIILNC